MVRYFVFNKEPKNSDAYFRVSLCVKDSEIDQNKPEMFIFVLSILITPYMVKNVDAFFLFVCTGYVLS